MYTFIKIIKKIKKMHANKSFGLARRIGSLAGKCPTRITTSGDGPRQIKILLLFLILSSVLSIVPLNAQAATTYYVRAGATGTNSGSDWSNAYKSLPASLVRGAVYYIADGNYPSYTFDDAESGSALIIIKKAIELDHGTNTGWSSSYGDGQARFTGSLKFYSSYYLIDGNSADWEYGFALSVTEHYGIRFSYWTAGTVSNITIKGLDATGTGSGGGCDYIVYIFPNASYITLQNVALHNTKEDLMGLERTDHIMIDKVYGYGRVDSGGSCHGDSMSMNSVDNLTVSNSKFDWDGQQFYFDSTVGNSFSNITIYGNLQYGGRNSGKCIFKDSGVTITNFLYYNNTCVDMNTTSTNVSGTYINNLWYNVPNPGAGTHSYGYYETGMSVTDSYAQYGGNPFTNHGGEDFTLDKGTNAGYTLGSAYNIDGEGNKRGSDGKWDRGAFEYSLNDEIPLKQPQPPTGLRIIE